MLVKVPRGWELPESAATPEHIYRSRRQFMKGAAAAGLVAGTVLSGGAARASGNDPTADLYPVARNPRYGLDRPLTAEGLATSYNNFYEFGSYKGISRAAQALKIRPWTVRIDGMVEKAMDVDIDDLIRRMPLEERLYRLRCVEAWSMAVPWSGFPMKALINLAAPLGSARYVVMETFKDPRMASGQKQYWYPWPYTEGLTLAEATSELAFMVTGLYGKPLPKQSGAPLRLAVPWKYGFKSIKSIVRFRFTDRRPVTFWNALQAQEYGFWANVNPAVPHPRWSQATERVLGTDERVPTRIWNGYGEFVAQLYRDIRGEKIFM